MHFLDLDLDVVHTIISHVDQKDMLQLATTCTSLYEPVMCQRLARLDTGNFTKRANLRKYFGYMLRDACRPQYLSSVALSSWPRAYEDADDDCGTEQFAQIIRQATRLTTLKCCPGNTECSAKPFLDAITSVKTLTSLELGLHDEDMLHVVSTLQSDPYRLLCWFLSPRDGAEPRVPVPHFFSKFVASSHLRQLELVNAPPSLFETGECDAVATLPSVRELIISQPVPSNLHLAPRIFPNVETLYLTHLTKKDQPQVPFAWPSVDYLSTDFEVAITGPVHHVSILAMSPCAQSYSDMLHRLRPSILECYLDQMYMQAVARLPQPMPFLHLRLVATLNESLQQYLVRTLPVPPGIMADLDGLV